MDSLLAHNTRGGGVIETFQSRMAPPSTPIAAEYGVHEGFLPRSREYTPELNGSLEIDVYSDRSLIKIEFYHGDPAVPESRKLWRATIISDQGYPTRLIEVGPEYRPTTAHLQAMIAELPEYAREMILRALPPSIAERAKGGDGANTVPMNSPSVISFKDKGGDFLSLA